MINDSISNLLTCLRNAIAVKRQIIKIPFTKIIYNILLILKNENFIKFFKMIKNLNIIYVFIEYTGPKKCEPIRKIIRLSKPSLRRFISVKTLTQATYKTHFMNGNSLCIISTSKGLMLDNQAQQLKIGGELMFLIA